MDGFHHDLCRWFFCFGGEELLSAAVTVSTIHKSNESMSALVSKGIREGR